MSRIDKWNKKNMEKMHVVNSNYYQRHISGTVLGGTLNVYFY